MYELEWVGGDQWYYNALVYLFIIGRGGSAVGISLCGNKVAVLSVQVEVLASP